MALSQFLLSATLLVLGTPPLHHHFPQPGPVCAEHRLGFALSPEAAIGSGMVGDWPWDATLLGFSDALVQHQAPMVALLEAGPPSSDLNRQVFSADVPAFWTPVPYGPLTVEVRLVTTAEMVESPENVVLLLDNRPLEPRRHALPGEPPRMLENGLLQITYRYSLPCPQPGKHILQARYKLDGLWSRLSAPLHFDVRLPDPPQIIGISDGHGNPVPIHSSQMLSISSPSLKLQLAQVNHDASLVAYLNGKPVTPSGLGANCCRTVPLEGHIPPGVHRLTVRTVHRDGECTITSEASNEVVFRYYDESVYLLKPGRNCDNRQNSADRSREPACTAAEQDGNTRPAAESPASDLPSITTPNNAFGVSANPIVQYIAFTAAVAEEEGDEETDVAEEPVDEEARDEGVESSDFSDQTKEMVVGAVQLRSAMADALREVEEAAGAAKTQASWASQASQAAAGAHETANEAQEEASSSHKEANGLIQEANAFSAPAAADARKQAQHQWRTVEEKFREIVQLADLASEQAHTAANQARGTEAIAARVENELEAAQASKAEADQAVARIRTLADRVTASETSDDDLEAIGKLSSSLRESKKRAIALRDCVHRLRDSAIIHRQATEKAKTEAVKAKQAAEKACENMAAAIDRLKPRVDAARYHHVKSLGDELERFRIQAKTAAERANDSLNVANRAGDVATDHASAVREERAAAVDLQRRIGDELEKARTGVEHAERNVRKLDERGDSAEAREAGRQAKAAALARDAAIQRMGDFDGVLARIHLSSSQALESLQHAADRAEAAKQAAGTAATANTMTQGAKVEAEDFLDAQQWLQAIDKGDEAKRYAEQATHAAAGASEHAAAAETANREAATARSQMQAAMDDLEQIRDDVARRAKSAQNRAADAGLVEQLEAEGREAWDTAMAETVHQRLEERKRAAAVESDQPADVRLADVEARAAEELADHEQAKADARIRQGQAEARHERASAITGPPSPFYFAAPAHFPIRGFGAGGKVIERPGAVIYEDMVFSFDRDGNYHLRFSTLIPDLPATLHLQLQLQPYPEGPWYTITLPTQHFRPEDSRSGRPQPRVFQDHVIRGRSEILHRCYGEMGKDATIRRTGSARFGYGFDAMRDTAAR